MNDELLFDSPNANQNNFFTNQMMEISIPSFIQEQGMKPNIQMNDEDAKPVFDFSIYSSLITESFNKKFGLNSQS